jgi:hydroxyacylglutathione hydrolase
MIPLEDFFEDIVGKAQRGLKVDDATLARRANLDVKQLRELKKGNGSLDWIPGVATILGLNAEALTISFNKSWYPNNVPSIDGMLQFNSELLDMTVNAYLVWCPESKEAVVFDTGADELDLVTAVSDRRLTLKYLFLTHTHEDHIAKRFEIISGTQAEVYCPEKERIEYTKAIKEGDAFKIGSLSIEVRLTNGHTPGGTSYVIKGLAHPVVVVGDSLFAGSMGGAPDDYANALRNNREKILTLPGETIICPGHGPLTTVSNELEHNPFYA